MIRQAVSELVVRNRKGIAADLPLRHPKSESPVNKQAGGSRGP